MYRSEDNEDMVLTEIRTNFKAKQRPRVEPILKAIQRAKGLTCSMTITIIRNMRTTGKIFHTKYWSKESLQTIGEDCSILSDQTNYDSKPSECRNKLLAEASRCECQSDDTWISRILESPGSLYEHMKIKNTPEKS